MSHYKLRFFYSVLGVRPRASAADIRSLFLKQCKIYHPDNPETGNQSKFIRIKEAYEQIKDAPLLKTKSGHPGLVQSPGRYVRVDGLYK